MKRIGLISLVGVMILSCQQEEGGKPDLYSPIDRATIYHPTFIWESTGDEYELELSDDSTFATIKEVWPGLVDTTYTPTDSLDEGLYYWRVRAMLNAWGEWSDVSSFSVVGPAWGLISPPDADTVKQPTLVWNSVDGVSSYHLSVYKGQPVAGHLVIDEEQADTSYSIATVLDPATYHWMIEVSGICSDTFRFVTYTLDETYFPVGQGYEWEYMCIDYGLPSHGDYWADTTYSTTYVREISSGRDSVCVYFGLSDIPLTYRDDSIFGHRYCIEGRGEKLFPEEGDSISFWDMYMKIQWTSDTTFRYGYGPNWDFGEIYIDYYDYGKGLGNILREECHGWRYHTEPEYSWYDGGKSVLLNLDKGE